MKVLFFTLLFTLPLFAKTAHDYFKNASFLYVQSKIDQALVEVDEGLHQYPVNKKLQMLKERIEEIKKQQKDQQKNKSDQKDQNQQDQQDQEKNKDQQDSQDQQGESSNQESQSSNQGDGGSSAEGKKQEEPKDTQADENKQPEEPQGELSPEEAEALLNDFDEEDVEKNEQWKSTNGQKRPLKDW